MIDKRIPLLFLLLLVISPSLAADYLWPLPYGRELTGVFGDWRSRRYHAGIDIRTGGTIGKVVVAPHDCRLYRIKTSYYGYGKVIYLKLKDGNIVVLAHLSRFRPEVEEYIRLQQLAAESYEQDIILPDNMFSYLKGDTVAWSGATGSGAPHLHLEIRTPDNKPRNPLSFTGFEVKDRRAPVFRRLRFLYALDDEFARALGYPVELKFAFDKKSGAYHLTTPISCSSPPFWLAAEIIDKVTKNNWPKTVYSLELRQGDDILYQHSHNSIDFAHNYLIDARCHFQMALAGKKFFHNLVNSAMMAQAAGLCGLCRDTNQPLTVIAADIHGNSSWAVIEFDRLRPDSNLSSTLPFQKPDYRRLAQLLDEQGRTIDDLRLLFRPAGDSLYLLFHCNSTEEALFDLVDLRGEIIRPQALGDHYYLAVVDHGGEAASPDRALPSLRIRKITGSGGEKLYTIAPDFSRPLVAGKHQVRWISDDGRLEMIMPLVEQTFFPLDRNCYFQITAVKSQSEMNYAIFPDHLAARRQIAYRYRFGASVPPGAGLYQVDDTGGLSFLGAEIDSAALTVQVQSYRLGTISMRVDTIAPSIRKIKPRRGAAIGRSRPAIKAKLADSLSGIKDDIEIRVDGVWLIPEYDPESGWVKAVPHFDLKPGRHQLDIIVTDRIGNQRHYKGHFTLVVRNR